MLFTITPDTSHGDLWLYLFNQVPDSILVLRSPLSTFHATFIAYLAQICNLRTIPLNSQAFCPFGHNWFLLSALPVQHGSRRGAVFSALIIYQGGRDFYVVFTRYILVHTSLFFLTRKDLAASESGFSSEDIYTTMRNPPGLYCS